MNVRVTYWENQRRPKMKKQMIGKFLEISGGHLIVSLRPAAGTATLHMKDVISVLPTSEAALLPEKVA